MTSTPTTPNPDPARKTLGLTGVTINAMALVAPGTFLWLLYQTQAAGALHALPEIWPGVLAALCGALISALAFSELARRYPEAGFRSAYHFAEKAFQDHTHPRAQSLEKLAKFVTGWAAHLYYWVYPGVMVAFMGNLADYLLRQFGYRPTLLGQVILASAFAAFVGFLALRGITGTTTTSVVLNTIQLLTLFTFSGLAIAFRVINPLGLQPSEWVYPWLNTVVLPQDMQGILFQAALAMMLMTGFEASTALGANANRPQRDIPRGTVLALVLQGVLIYLVSYLAVGLAFNTRLSPPNASTAPIGELAWQVGDALLAGNGFSLMLVLAFTVIVALLGSTLTAMNNGVRITFSMALDKDMPDLLGFLHPRYATPYVTVVALSIFSAILGMFGLLGGLPALMGIILAGNLGALALYALLCVLTMTAYWQAHSFHLLRHGILPGLGLLANLGTMASVIVTGFTRGGVISQGAWIAIGLASLWLAFCIGYFVLRRQGA